MLCTWTLSALDTLRNALYKFKTYLLIYLLTYIMQRTVSRQTKPDTDKTIKHFEIREDGADVLLKAHVNHTVGFIEAEVPANLQVQHLLVKHVHQTAWRCCYNVYTPANNPIHLLTQPAGVAVVTCISIWPHSGIISASLAEGSLVQGFGHLENRNQRKQDKQCNNSLPHGSVRVRTQPRGLDSVRSTG